MAGVNKVILVGHLGKDPEIMTFDNGVKKASFSLATTESYKNKEGQRVDQTEWHNIVLWRGLAEIAETYLKKGSLIYLEGRIRTRQWEDQTGNKRYSTDIEGLDFKMLSSKPKDEQAGSYAPQPTSNTVSEPAPIPEPEDDLPF